MNDSMLAARNKCRALETKRRLSESVLWKLQREYFERQGIAAWSGGKVPHHITSSPFIADAYARIVLGFVRDADSGPIHIVELGSGCGRFSHLFLKRFLELQRNSRLKHIPIKYVMTDVAEQNLEYWRTHPRFQPFVAAGSLDFARFNVEHDETLKLIHSGETLSPVGHRTTLVVIANYLFDSVPQDAFFVSGGHLFETLVSVSMKDEDQDDADILSQIELSYDYNPINANYYDDPKWNRILTAYQNRLTATPFLFPTSALRCMRNLYRLSNGNMLLLSGDRGYSSDQALLAGNGAPVVAMHGSISMMVDYQIIGEYCRELGGQVLHPPGHTPNLNVSAFLLGDHADDFVETKHAYTETIVRFGPDDLFTLKEGIAPLFEELSVDQILAFLRLSCWDYLRFWECLGALKKHLPNVTDIQKQELRNTILKVWDHYLPIGEEHDLAFALGTLLLEIEFPADALEFLQRSVELYGIAPGSAYNLAVCHYGLGRMDHAREFADKALELDHEFAEARTLRKTLKAELSSKSKKQRKEITK